MARLKGMKGGTKASKEITKMGGHLTAPKEYRAGGATSRKQYADPKRFKYPIDTAKHVRAALGYFAKGKNSGIYSPAERKAIAGRIRAAAKRMGISVGSAKIKGMAGKKK